MVLEGVNLAATIRSLESAGFYDVLLPFILVFTIIFAVLQKVKIFGRESKNINVVVAILIAFFTIRAQPVIALINQFLPKVSAMVLILMMFLLILGVFGTSAEGWTGWPFFLAVLGSIIGVGWSVYTSIPGISSSSLPTWLRFSSTDKGLLLLVGIVLIIIVMFKDDNLGRATKFRDEFGPDKLGRGRP